MQFVGLRRRLQTPLEFRLCLIEISGLIFFETRGGLGKQEIESVSTLAATAALRRAEGLFLSLSISQRASKPTAKLKAIDSVQWAAGKSMIPVSA